MHVLVVEVPRSAFPVACLWGLSDVTGARVVFKWLWWDLKGMQPPDWKPSVDWIVVLVIDLATF